MDHITLKARFPKRPAGADPPLLTAIELRQSGSQNLMGAVARRQADTMGRVRETRAFVCRARATCRHKCWRAPRHG